MEHYDHYSINLSKGLILLVLAVSPFIGGTNAQVRQEGKDVLLKNTAIMNFFAWVKTMMQTCTRFEEMTSHDASYLFVCCFVSFFHIH